jgi:ABC-type polysaccharide/polyol phosphate export permease
MNNPHRRFRRGPGGEFWLLIAVLMLLATLALLHLAVQKERNSGLAIVDVQTLSELFSISGAASTARTAHSPS